MVELLVLYREREKAGMAYNGVGAWVFQWAGASRL